MIKIKDTLGNQIEIEIPHIDSLTLSRGLIFQVTSHNITDWLFKQIKDETFENERNYYLYLVADSLSKFYKVDINMIMKWNVEDLLDEDGNLFDQVAQKHLSKEVYDRDGIGAENLLLYLYDKTKAIFDSYKYVPCEMGEDYTFAYKGEIYTIPHIIKSMLLGKVVRTKTTVGQSIDILKVKKFLANVSGYQEDVKHKMNVTFVSYMQIFAILALKKDEEYPTKPEEAKRFVQERVEHFKDIDFITASEVVFFLTTTGKV